MGSSSTQDLWLLLRVPCLKKPRPLLRNCRSQNPGITLGPPSPCAHTQLLTNLPFHLLTSSLILQLPSTGTTNSKVLTLQHIMPSTLAQIGSINQQRLGVWATPLPGAHQGWAVHCGGWGGRKEGEAGQGDEGDRPGHKAGSKAGITLPKTHDPSILLTGLFLPSRQPRAGPQQACPQPAVLTLLW